MADPDSDDDLECFTLNTQKYTTALIKFNNAIPTFEAMVPSVVALSYRDRAAFVVEKYEEHLFALHDRPTHLLMGFLRDIDELATFCTAVTLGWRLWPDYWVGLQLMLNYLADETLIEDVKRVDTLFLATLKEIALKDGWRNCPASGPALSAQAKKILIRYKSEEGRPLEGIMTGLSLGEGVDKKICEGIDCLEIETDEVKFLRCGKCKKAAYHSKECQVKAWKGGHKKVCAPPQQQ